MDLGLNGKSAFVAGASSGLGWATARQLLQEGCRVAICSRSEDRIRRAAEKMVSETGAPPDDVLPLVGDVTDERAVAGMVEHTVQVFGALNILITNAGGPPSGYIEDFSSEDWTKAIDLNLMSTVHLCRYAIPYLKEAAHQPDGLARIVMITSISAKQPIQDLLLSNVTRAGVQGLAKSLAESLGPDGITVNTILPGYTRTERLVNLSNSIQARTGKTSEEIETGWAQATALKRIADPSEFAAAAVFLCSARSSYITGLALPVDGGRSKHLL